MIYHCDRLFDGHAFHAHARVRVEGDRLAEVTTGVPPDSPAGNGAPLTRVAFGMPGLTDLHVHAIGQPTGWMGGRPFRPHELFLQLLLYAGVTSARDTGNSIEAVAHLRAWSDREQGPRLVSSGPVLDAPPLFWPFSRRATTVEEARHQVACLAQEGVDFIKCYTNVSPDVLEAAVAAAGEHGLRVSSYPGATTAAEACRAGVASVEHVVALFERAWSPAYDAAEYRGVAGRLRLWSRLPPDDRPLAELVELLARRGTAVCPTLVLSRRLALVDEMINEPYLDYLVPIVPFHGYLLRMRDPFGYAIGRRYMARHVALPRLDKQAKAEVERGADRLGELVAHLAREGVPLLPGSDAPNPSMVPGFGLHRELAEWVRCGVPVATALAAATSGAARHLGLDDAGVVRPGARADLLLLAEDPTVNLRALSSDRNQVVCRGRLVDRAALKAALVAAVEES